MLKSQYKLWDKLKNKYPGYFLEWEYSPDWLEKQRLDIADSKLCIGIEFDGIQHFEPVECFGGEEKFKWQQEQDLKKEECCINNSWTLLRLKYNYKKSDFDNICLIIDKIIKKVEEVENGK
jgi:very-short-patch-repair endonuclease